MLSQVIKTVGKHEELSHSFSRVSRKTRSRGGEEEEEEEVFVRKRLTEKQQKNTDLSG